MAVVTDKVQALIAPPLEDMGYGLVQVRLFSQHGRQTLQIMAERTDGRAMTVEDCADISRALSALLDVEDPIEGAYELEVSSPGIDRPLVRPQDFARFRGHVAKLTLHQPVSGRRRFKGTLGEMKDGRISLTLEDGEEVNLDLAAIEQAKLVLTDALLKEYQQA